MSSSKEDNDKLLSDSRRARLIVLWSIATCIGLNIVLTVVNYVWFDGGLISFGITLMALVAFTLVLFINAGPNPRLWWKAVWGTEILLDYNRQAGLTIEDRAKHLEDIEKWIQSEITKGDVVKVNPWRYHFRRKDQAMLFKMTWL